MRILLILLDMLIGYCLGYSDKQGTTSPVAEPEPETTTSTAVTTEAETPSSTKSSMPRFSYKDGNISPRFDWAFRNDLE